MSEEQDLILEHLKIINQFESDPIYSLSLFQMHFLDYLEDKASPSTRTIFDTWDTLDYEKRIELCVKFLKEEKLNE